MKSMYVYICIYMYVYIYPISSLIRHTFSILISSRNPD